MNDILKYGAPATQFIESMLLGNGYIGAAVYGGTNKERYSINEVTLWSGYPSCDTENGNPEVFNKVKELMLEGKNLEASKLLDSEFSGHNTQYYLPLGNIIIENDTEECTKYERRLDMSTAIHTVEYSGADYVVNRESFISNPARVMVIKIKGQGVNKTKISFESQLRQEISAKGNDIIIRGVAPTVSMEKGKLDDATQVIYSENDAQKGMKYTSVIRVVTDSETLVENNSIAILGGEDITVYFSVVTSFKDYKTHPYLDGKDCEAPCFDYIENAVKVGYESLREQHIKDHSELYGRTEFSINAKSDKYTDKLLREAKSDVRFELLFNIGKYLTIAASREGGQVMNLQGLWNEKLLAPWRSNCTININTEMNYMPTMKLNLAECFVPYAKMVEEIADNGSKVAKVWYGIDGIVVHHNTDLWRLANPVGYKRTDITLFSFFNTTYGWLLWGLYDRFLIDRDTEYLKNTLYPLIIKCAETLLQMFHKDEEGRLYPFPSTSPENEFILDSGEACSLSNHSAISNAIARDVMAMAAESSEILGYTENAKFYADIKEQIMPYLIGSDGRILEWDKQWLEREIEHRHVSHLYGLHPAREITPDSTPKLAEACRKSLDVRGDGGTGWCIAWKANMWARLHDGDRALKLLETQLVVSEHNDFFGNGGTYVNMLCAHPPFQIDGNFGAASAIMEMLVQCVGNKVYLLPALPTSWDSGHIKGIRINGGATLDLSWQNGKVSGIKVYPESKQKDYEFIY